MAKRKRDPTGSPLQKVSRTDEAHGSPSTSQPQPKAEKGREPPHREELTRLDESKSGSAERTRNKDLVPALETRDEPSRQCANGDAEQRSSDDVERDDNDGDISSADGPANENNSDGATTVEDELAEEREELGNSPPLPGINTPEVGDSDRVMDCMHGAEFESERATTVEDDSAEELEERGIVKPPGIETSGRVDGAGDNRSEEIHADDVPPIVRSSSDLGEPSSSAGRNDISETADAQPYFRSKKPRHDGRRLQIARTSEANGAGIGKWELLPKLAVVRFGGEDFRPGEVVYIYTHENSHEPAALLDIRDTGDYRKRKEILISWLWDEHAVAKKRSCEAAVKIWERGVTHLLTNQFAILPWDTLNGHSPRGCVRIHTKEYLDFHKEVFTMRPSDQLKAMINCSALNFIFT